MPAMVAAIDPPKKISIIYNALPRSLKRAAAGAPPQTKPPAG
jgi:hypothetical protein